MINLDDFRYMWRGQIMRLPEQADIKLLAPVDKRHEGNERALLLLHGFSSSPAVYRAIWPKLKNYNAIVCPVLPGHAESLAAFASATRDEWLETATSAYESLAQQYKQVEVMGLSLGGVLACHLAQKFPVQHLYLLAPALKLRFNTTLAKHAARILHTFGMRYIKNQAGNLFTHEHEELAYKKLPLRTLVELFNCIEEANFTLPPCPTDLFLGSHDDVVDSAYVAKQFEASTHCKVNWLQNSAHAIPLDGDTQIIISCINKNE